MSSVAVCDVNGDDIGDVVIGAPSADPGLGIGATGALFVVMGGSTARATIDVDNPGARDLRIFGVTSGDQLGAAVGCADIDGDTVDDIFVGAPRADTAGDDNAGKIYLIRGRSNLGSRRDQPRLHDQRRAVEWRGGAGNKLGACSSSTPPDAPRWSPPPAGDMTGAPPARASRDSARGRLTSPPATTFG